MKALEKDRTRRYETTNGLAMDIQRYLDGAPVQACPPTRRYRFGKFARRYRSLLSVGLLLSTAILLGSTTSIVQAVRATRAEQIAELGLQSEREARKDAEQAKEQAQRNVAEAYRQRYRAEIQLGQVDLDQGNLSRLYQTLVRYLPESGRVDLRGWEWNYLLSRCQHGRTLSEHWGTVRSLAWSPDGKHFASTSSDGDAIVWDAKSGRRVHRFSFGATSKRGIAWSPDGLRLAWGSANDENVVRIWDRRSDDIRMLRGHTHTLITCAWSPDGTRLATTAMDNTARIWDTETWECLHVLRGHDLHVYAACWTQDGHSLVTAQVDQDSQIKIWNTASGDLIREIPSETGFRSAAISPSSPHQLILGGSGGEIWIIDTNSWEILHKIAGHTGGVKAIAISPDGKRFASGGQEGKVIIWDAANYRELFALRSTQFEVSSLAWNPKGEQVMAGYSGGAIKLWDLPPRQPVTTAVLTSELIRSIQWREEDRRLVCTGWTTGATSSWDLSTNKVAEAIVDSPSVESAISPDGQFNAEVLLTAPQPGSVIHVNDRNSKKIVCELDFPFSHNNSKWPKLVWSPDSRRLAAIMEVKMVLWEIPSGQRAFDWDGASITSAAWATDSNRLALGDNHHVHIIDVDQKSRIFTKNINQHVLTTSVAWNSTCDKIASGTQNGEIGVWDIKTGRQLFKVRPHVTTIRSLDWTYDDSRIASACRDGSVKVFNAQTGEELLTLIAGKEYLSAVKWSSDGSKLAAGDIDGRVYYWTAQGANGSSDSVEQRRALAEMHALRSTQRNDQEDLPLAIAELSTAIELAPSQVLYRLRRADLYAQQGQFEEALTDLNAALDLDPEDRSLLRARMGLYADLGRWAEALADSSRLVELIQNGIYRYQSAVIELMLGNMPAYRDICRVESVGQIFEVSQAQTHAWTCSLAPGSVTEYERSLTLVQEMLAQEKDSTPIGALLYRVGQTAEAAEALTEASRFWERAGSIEAPGSSSDLLPGYTWYFLAMACHDLGRYPESRSWYDKAEAYAQTMLVTKSGSLNWHQRAVLEMLQRETRAHIGAESNNLQK